MTHPAKIAAWISTVVVLGLSMVSCPLSAVANSTPPALMTYQSFITDKNGDPLGKDAPKNYDVIFRIYNAQTDGTVLWAEQQTVTVDKGYFSVLLGEGSAVDGPRQGLDTLFTPTSGDLSDRYVEMTVKGIGTGTPAADVVIKPRLRLMTSPYAFVATKAINAANLVNGSNGQVVVVGGSTGNYVGINKAAPTVALDVSGDASISGSLGVNGNVSANNVTANGAFSGNGTIPLGGIIMWAGSKVPDGWALCNGANGTPNLVGRFIFGSSNTGSGVPGGFSTVTLTTDQIPPHAHPYQDDYMVENTDDFSDQSAFNGGHDVVRTSKPWLHGNGSLDWNNNAFFWRPKNTLSACGLNGVAQPVSIMPPYYTLAYIMRVK